MLGSAALSCLPKVVVLTCFAILSPKFFLNSSSSSEMSESSGELLAPKNALSFGVLLGGSDSSKVVMREEMGPK